MVVEKSVGQFFVQPGVASFIVHEKKPAHTIPALVLVSSSNEYLTYDPAVPCAAEF